MKKVTLLLALTLISMFSFGQITFSKYTGSSVKTNLGNGFLNDKSTLKRQWIVLNDLKCPLKLDSILGIKTMLIGSQYYFIGDGSFLTTVPIVAYELHHILYNVFGNYMLTLSKTSLEDIATSNDKVYSEWIVNKNQLIEYFTCVSYVASVRTQKGIIWKFSPAAIKLELNKRQIVYEESFKPKI